MESVERDGFIKKKKHHPKLRGKGIETSQTIEIEMPFS